LETARNNARGTLLTLSAGLLAAGALAFTARNFILSQRTLALTEQGQVTERYTKAIEQLGSDKLDVRIGGIYALERIASDSARDHPTVIEVLSTFIREHSTEPGPLVPLEHGGSRARADVLAAATVIGRRNVDQDTRAVNLRGANLAGADLTKANLAGVTLDDANLSGATLTNATLVSADLSRTNLSGATGRDADFSEAVLQRADLKKSEFIRAKFKAVNLQFADATGAHLAGSDFRGALLTGSKFADADLTLASFLSFFGNVDFTGADLTDAWTSRGRILPEAIAAKWALNSENRLEPRADSPRRYI